MKYNRKIIFLLIFAVIIALSTGCAPKDQNANSSDKPSKNTTASEPASGVVGSKEKVLYAQYSPTGTTDKMQYVWQLTDGILPHATYRALLMPNSTFTDVKPDLASDWSLSSDKLTYTFTLKSGLKWSDGHPLTAKDVKFSIKAALKVSLINGIFPAKFLQIEGAQEFRDGTASDVKGIQIEGNNITITLKKPVGSFLQIIAQFFILPEHVLALENLLELHNNNFWTDPVTSGMFKVKEINPGNYMIFDRNPNYEGEKPLIDLIVVNFFKDPVLAIQDNKCDLFSTNFPDQISQIKSIKGITEFPIDILFYRYFIVNLAGYEGKGNSPLANPRIREAFLYAINRQELVDKVLTNVAKIANTGVPSVNENFWADANQYPYDPEKAKQILKEENFDFNHTIKIAYYYKDQKTSDLMQAICYQFSKIGVRAESFLIQGDATTELFKTRKYDLAYKGLSSFGYDSWYTEYTSANSNFSNILDGDKSFDQPVDKFLSITDLNERKQSLLELQKLEQEKLLKLPLYNIQNVIFVNTDKIKLPDGLKFGNPYFRFDYQLEKWDIK